MSNSVKAPEKGKQGPASRCAPMGFSHPRLGVFIALRALVCERCAGSIQPQDVFVRAAAVNGIHAGIKVVLCSRCEPVSGKALE